MHKNFVSNVIARILLVICFMLLLPLAWAIFDDANSIETQAFIKTILLGSVLSFFILKYSKVTKQDYFLLTAKDGLAVVGLSWIFVSVFGSLPFLFSGTISHFTDAFFETVSGFTTTGATIFTDVESLPRGILFWRSLTHWLGGMGIIVLCLAILPALKHNAFQLYKAEVPGVSVERIAPRLKETAKTLWIVYFILSFAETCLLMLGGMPFFDSLCHTFGTMATGGFSTRNASIGAYAPYIQWVIIVFMFLAGTNFMLNYLALKGKWKEFFKNEEFKYYIGLILITASLFSLVLYRLHLSGSPIRTALFQVVSILTTTGYCTADFNLWPHALQFVLICLMFIGGCGGSTGGGMKVVRVLVSIKAAMRSIVQAILPKAVIPIKFNREICKDPIVFGVFAFVIIFVLLFFIGTIGIIITENCDLVTGISASIACLSNIGPGLGKVGATQNYAWISMPGKWILIFLMFAGRLELYSILILFISATWRK